MAQGPIRGLRFIHNAIRAQAADVDTRCAALTDPAQASAVAPSIEQLVKAVRGHAKVEDIGYFPTLNERAPRVCDAFSFDHEDEEPRLAALERLGNSCGSATDLGALQRTAALVREHLELHMTKEEQLLWPLTEELFSAPEQGGMMTAMLGAIPRDELPGIISWMVGTLRLDEAVEYVRLLQSVQPPEVFATTVGWLRERVSAGRWSEVSTALPELPA